MAEPNSNAAATPNVTATPNATNTAKPSSGGDIQAKIAAMQAKAVASASQPAKNAETLRLNQSSATGNASASNQVTAINQQNKPTAVAPVSGVSDRSLSGTSAAPISPAVTNAPVQTTYQTGKSGTTVEELTRPTPNQPAEKMVYDPRQGGYIPASEAQQGSPYYTDYTKEQLYTPQEKQTVDSFLKGDTDTSILATEDYNNVKNIIGDKIAQGETSLTNIEQHNYEQYVNNLPPEIQAINNRIKEYEQMNSIDYSALSYDSQTGKYVNKNTGQEYDQKMLDPSYRLIAQQQNRLDEMLGQDISSIHEQYSTIMEDQIALNKTVLGKAKAAENAAGHIGSMLADGYIQSTIQGNERALRDISTREQQALTEAKRNYLDGDMQLAWKQLEIAESRRSEYNQLVQAQFNMKQTYFQRLETRQANIDAANRAMRAENKEDFATFSNYLLDSGMSIEEVPDEYISKNFPMLTTAQARGIFSVAKQEKQVADLDMAVKNIALLKAPLEMESLQNQIETHSYGVMSDIMNIGKGVQAGVKFAEFNGNSYYGTFGDDVIEKDSNGYGYQVVTNPFTGEQSLRELGYLGGEKQSDFEIMMMNGEQVLFDKTTGTYQPMGGYGTNGTTANYKDGFEAMEPTGSYHYRGGQLATQCGQYVNDYTGIGFGDSLENKISLADPSIGTTENPIQVGDAVITNEGGNTYGHVAMVNSIVQTPDGRTQLVLSESNYKKDSNGRGIVTHNRPLYADSSVVKGFARGNKPNFLQTQSGLTEDGSLINENGERTDLNNLRMMVTGSSPGAFGDTSGVTTSTGIESSPIWKANPEPNLLETTANPDANPNYQFQPRTSGMMTTSEYQEQVDYARTVNDTAQALYQGTMDKDTVEKQFKGAQLTDILTTASAKGWSQSKSTGEDVNFVTRMKDLAESIYNDKRLPAAVGPISSWLPTLRGDTATFNRNVAGLKDMLTKENLGMLKGSMSDKDIEFLRNIGTTLDVGMGEEGFKKEVNRIINMLNDKLEGTEAAPQQIYFGGQDFELIQ